MPRLALLLTAVLVLVGCGASAQSKFDDAERDALFATVDLRIAQDVQRNAADLPAATRTYIALVRQYRDDLGSGEARELLTEKASQVQPYCPTCAAKLVREVES